VLALVAAPHREEKVEHREVPEPAPARQEAVVDVHAISLNRGEWNRLTAAQAGWRPGWDVAGIVAQPAQDGSGPAKGARVVGLVSGGGWCERVAVPTVQLTELPQQVSFSAAATLPVAGLTALRTLRVGGLLLGKRVLITGAAGGVGRFAIQLASRGGAHVVGVVGRPERAEGLAKLGAEKVVIGFDGLDSSFELILESAGGASLAGALKLVASSGTVVSFGNSSREQTTFLVNDFYTKGGARVYGFFLFHELRRDPAQTDLAYLASLVAERRLDPQIALEGSWREAGAALAALSDRRLAGKAVLHLR